VALTPDARAADCFEYDAERGRVRQWLLSAADDEGGTARKDREWWIEGEVDLAASRAEGKPVMRVMGDRAIAANAGVPGGPPPPSLRDGPPPPNLRFGGGCICLGLGFRLVSVDVSRLRLSSLPALLVGSDDESNE
jgi:hypothetical protein